MRRDSDALVVLNHLYKKTELQRSFAGNLMAVLDNGRMPQQLTLRAALSAFLEFRVSCVERRSEHKLKKACLTLPFCPFGHTTSPPPIDPRHVPSQFDEQAESRLHIVEGLLLAQERMGEVIDAIRSANSSIVARQLLESSAFGLSSVQAEAILQMQVDFSRP